MPYHMSSMLLLKAVTLSLVLKTASCIPTTPIMPLPKDVTHLAHDTENGQYVALWKDGSLYRRYSDVEMRELDQLGKRASGSCTPLTADDLKKLPGFAKIDKYFKDTYGDGKVDIVTNPEEYPDSPALLCADTNSVPVTIDNKPSCTSSKSTTQGKLDGTNGSMSITHTQGFSNEATWTVEKASSIGTNIEFSVSFGIPGIDDFETSVSVSTTFTNTLSNSFSTKVDNTDANTLEYDVPMGKQCHGQLDTKTCNVGGKAEIPLIAKGWVWYNYKNQHSAPGSDEKHYKWASTIESILTDVNDRQEMVSVTGQMAADSKSNFEVVCDH